MLKVHDYLAIRTAHAQGESKRSIARRLRHSQDTVRAAVASETGRPPPFKRTQPAVRPKLGAFVGVIDAILAADESAPVKQRHTAMQVHRRLVAEHAYRGGYDQVRRYVAKRRSGSRPTLIPLRHEPGERIECDFGEVQVDFPHGRRGVDVLVMVWSFSHAPFMMALPNQRTESVLAGMTAGLHFFGAVPREVWWDNPKTIATVILRGRERVLNPDYAHLASHYRFQPRACVPAKGQEKPDVESGVKALQKRACTPVPAAADLADLNRRLHRFCLSKLDRTVSGQTQTIGERFDADRRQAIPLPAHRFDPCVSSAAVVDKYQTVRLDNNRYSVPREAAFRGVAVRAYVDRVVVLLGDRVVAEHRRSYERGALTLDPLHYLAALSIRPGALDHGGVFKDWRFGRRLRALRKARGLTQEQLGRAAGMDYKHLGSLERGVDAPSFDAIKRLAKTLDAEYHESFLPDRLASGGLEQQLQVLARDVERLDSKAVKRFFADLLAAVHRLEQLPPPRLPQSS